MNSDDILDALNDSDFDYDSGSEYIPTSSDEHSDSSDTDVDPSTNTLVSNSSQILFLMTFFQIFRNGIL